MCAGVAHPHQDRPDLEPARHHLDDVAHPARRVGVGEDQHVRRPLEARVREDARAQLGVERRVGMHLALVLEVELLAVEDRERRPRPPAGAGVEVAELRVRADRDLRHQPEAAHVPRRGDHHVGDLLRRRLGVDLGVGDEDDPPLVDHQRQRADRAAAARRRRPAPRGCTSGARGTARRCRRSGCRRRRDAPSPRRSPWCWCA